MQTPNKTHKKISTTAMIILIASISIAAYALGTYIFHLNFTVDNTRGVKIAGAWIEDNIEGKAVVPGDTFTLSQKITNISTDYVYVFVRIDTLGNVYKISGVDSSWTVVKEADDKILLAYGSSAEMTKLAPNAPVEIEGTLTLDVTNAEFADLPDEALDFTINACGVGKSQCDTHYLSPTDVYDAYITSGGK